MSCKSKSTHMWGRFLETYNLLLKTKSWEHPLCLNTLTRILCATHGTCFVFLSACSKARYGVCGDHRARVELYVICCMDPNWVYVWVRGNCTLASTHISLGVWQYLLKHRTTFHVHRSWIVNDSVLSPTVLLLDSLGYDEVLTERMLCMRNMSAESKYVFCECCSVILRYDIVKSRCTHVIYIHIETTAWVTRPWRSHSTKHWLQLRTQLWGVRNARGSRNVCLVEALCRASVDVVFSTRLDNTVLDWRHWKYGRRTCSAMHGTP